MVRIEKYLDGTIELTLTNGGESDPVVIEVYEKDVPFLSRMLLEYEPK